MTSQEKKKYRESVPSSVSFINLLRILASLSAYRYIYLETLLILMSSDDHLPFLLVVRASSGEGTSGMSKSSRFISWLDAKKDSTSKTLSVSMMCCCVLSMHSFGVLYA